MKKVLVFSYLHRHFKKLLPVIKEFQKDENIQLYVLLMTEEEKNAAFQEKIEFKMLDEFTLAKRSRDFDLGWGLEPLINAIDIIKPDLFVAIEVNNILRNAIRYCKQIKIPNIVIQHGTPNQFSLIAFAPFEGDYFAAWGQFTKEFLLKNHVAKEKIILTGGPCFDRTLSLKPDKKALARELRIDPNKKWLTFTTQNVGAGGYPTEEEIFVGVTETARNILAYPDYQLIYQVHPGQKIEEIQVILDSVVGNNAIVVKYRDTEKLLAASDGVITFFSTTAIDAIILSKPLLLINLSDDTDFFPFVPMGAAFAAYRKEDIAKGLYDLMYNGEQIRPNLNKAAEYVNFKNDGNALQRVMNLCYQILYPKN